jgi:hypothetical protein
VIRVSAAATVAMRWLIPRLPLFTARYLDVDVRVSTTLTTDSALRGSFDLAIRRKYRRMCRLAEIGRGKRACRLMSFGEPTRRQRARILHALNGVKEVEHGLIVAVANPEEAA